MDRESLDSFKIAAMKRGMLLREWVTATLTEAARPGIQEDKRNAKNRKVRSGDDP